MRDRLRRAMYPQGEQRTPASLFATVWKASIHVERYCWCTWYSASIETFVAKLRTTFSRAHRYTLGTATGRLFASSRPPRVRALPCSESRVGYLWQPLRLRPPSYVGQCSWLVPRIPRPTGLVLQRHIRCLGFQPTIALAERRATLICPTFPSEARRKSEPRGHSSRGRGTRDARRHSQSQHREWPATIIALPPTLTSFDIVIIEGQKDNSPVS
ncbi:uncharacterized protein C8Q71DRAFT_500570 [Rhodofomes roseus]|uniref:Uncharacterized protein n=1 Tax=Rhodofomes roseus TaxID=34475 RepID=A0ABQ8KLH6_9APHY|nr:uncharacterized protein C8Q71DRAFT_500570 [Rhodofomes roseus]KAH9839177.1 hypothetical protein C8Q71DRAFT_500570 [Rhodofomes roseus]